jgi:hypothetical protein
MDRFGEAREVLREVVAIRRTLVATDPAGRGYLASELRLYATMCARTGTDLSGALAALIESSQLLQSLQESMSPQQFLAGSALVAMTTAEVLDGLGRDDEAGLHRELAKYGTPCR